LGNGTSTASSHLTTGAKAGIAVGAIFGVALLALIFSVILFILRRQRQDNENEKRKDELRARQAATINATNNGLRDRDGMSTGAAERYTQASFKKDPALPQDAPYNPAADTSLVKQNTKVDIHGIEQQAYYQYPPPLGMAYNPNPAVPAPQYQQPSPPLPTTYNPNLNPNSQAQSQQYQHSPPQPSHSALSDYNNSVQSHHNYPSPSPAQELASARLRTNVSPMNGSELEGGGLSQSLSVVSGYGPGHGYELP
jgi:hypothetical protein